jgi:hypothetical protein
MSSSSNSSPAAISLYFAGVSRYPLEDARVGADWLGSAKDGSQPLLRDVGGAGDGLGEGRLRFILLGRAGRALESGDCVEDS